MSDDAVLRAGTFGSIDPRTAGWRYLSFRVHRVNEGASVPVGKDGVETAAVVLSGSARAETGGGTHDLEGRENMFEGLPWALYLPSGVTAEVTATTALELAEVGAASDRGGEVRMVTPDDVEVEVRGAGSATRQINHIVPPAFPAHRLLVVEVLTPAGNWSSYPPHKHDTHDPPDEVQLEELYYFRVRPPDGFAFQRVYSPDHGTDVTAAVGDGDVVLVPHGYHVSGAPHAVDLYYLNGLAGDERSMAATDDPPLAWIRQTWAGMERDPRVPMTGRKEEPA
jgi:5-deoxy-glucuronate isomerase